MSWRAARCRITCHVRSLPPLSSGSSRPAFNQSSFMRSPSGARGGAGHRSVCTPSPSMKVRYQSSRLSRLQSASPRVGRAGGVGVDQRRDGGGVGDAALPRARSRAARRARVPAPAPRSQCENGTGNPIFLRVRISARQDRLHRLAQDPLRGQAAQFHPWRQRGRELHEVVIQEGHAALDRRRHAHLVLLHQQLHQVRLQVGVEQPVERAAVAVRRDRNRPARRRRRPPWRGRRSEAPAARPAAAARSRRSCRRTSPRASAASPGTIVSRSARPVPAGAAAPCRLTKSRIGSGARFQKAPARQLASARGYFP